jgi:excisionase family DNA binding protein
MYEMESDAALQSLAEALYPLLAAKFEAGRVTGEELPGWLDTRSAAAYLDLSLKAFESKLDRREVPVHRMGRSLRFLPSELDALVT